jgi:hypothetical protein
MPRIKRELHPATDKFNELRHKATVHNESNDCAVKALAIVTDADYSLVRNLLALRGRKPRRGTNRYESWQVLEELGFTSVVVPTQQFIDKYPSPHCKVLKNVTTHHPDRFPDVWRDGNTYLLYSRGHVGALVNGENHDWTRGSAKRVYMIRRIIKKEA